MWRLFNSIYIGPTTGKDREAYGDNRVLWEWETRNYSLEYYSSLSESTRERERERKKRTRSEEAPCSGLLSTVVFWQQGCYWVRHDKLMGQVWGTGQDRRRKSGGVRENWVWVSRATHPVPSRIEREGRTF